MSLFFTSLPSFCADDISEQEASKNITFSCNIPGLNVPLQLERINSSIDKIQLMAIAIDHGSLLAKQLKLQQNVQQMIIDHALLAAFRITVGLTSAVCHEFGHAISAHYHPHTTLKTITVRWSADNILLGSFGGETNIIRRVARAEINNDQFDEQHANTIQLLHENKDVYRNSMIDFAAGPLLGALSAYMAYKGSQYIYPSLSCGLTTCYEIGNQISNLIPTKHIVVYVCKQGIARIPYEQTQHELQELLVEVEATKSCGDGELFYEAWYKRKEMQESIDKCKKL